MKRALVGLILALVLLGITGCGGSGHVDVPIDLKDTSNLGSLHVELTYDTNILKAVEVKPGKLAEKATIEYNLTNPGRVVIGIIDANGINGDGIAATVLFEVIGKGTSALVLENVEAYDAGALRDIVTDISTGSFNEVDSSVDSPVIVFRGGQ